MAKLTGPFVIERVYHGTNARRSGRSWSRRKPQSAESSDYRPSYAFSQVPDSESTACNTSWQIQACGADDLTGEPQLPENWIRQPWWSRPATQESSLPELALKAKEQGRSSVWMENSGPLAQRAPSRPRTTEALNTLERPLNSIENLGSKNRISTSPVLAPPEVVELALALNKLRAESASSRGSQKVSNASEPTPLSVRSKPLPKRRSPQVLAWEQNPWALRHDNHVATAHLTGWVKRCAKCNLYLGDEKTKFCRGCGDPRLENKAVGEVFFALIGSKRTILRRTDLTKLVQHVRYLHHKEESLTRQALHRVTLDFSRFFDQVLAFQLGEGDPHSHGLTLEYFAFFLGKVANSRNMVVKDLITFLSEELHGQKRKDLPDDSSIASPEVSSSLNALSAVRALADQCPQCGLCTDGNQFCRKCGYKLKDPNSAGANSGLGLGSFFQKKARREVDDGVDLEALMALASQYNLSLDDVRRKREEFRAYDKTRSGALTYSEFIEAVRHHTNTPAPAPIPEHLLSAWHKTAHQSDKDEPCMGFEEFLIWSCNTEYSEEMLVTDMQERNLRQLARDNGLCLPEVERIKMVFDKFDKDKSGFIDEHEFRHVLLTLLRVKNPSDLPQSKVRRCWREIDSDMSGSVAFDEFLIWYFACVDDR